MGEEETMEDLQGILEKINRDGVEKANAAAAQILADAKAKAAAVAKAAAEEAARVKAEAEKSAAASSARAAETIRQAARDTVLKVESSVTAMLGRLLAKEVDKALADEKTLAELVTEAVRGLAGPAEVAVPPKLAPALKAALAS